MNFEIKFVLINCLNNTFSIPYGENFLSNITQFWTFHYYLLSPRAKKQLLAITFAHVKSSPLHVDGSLDLTWGTVVVFAWFSEWFDHTGTYLFFYLQSSFTLSATTLPNTTHVGFELVHRLDTIFALSLALYALWSSWMYTYLK